MTHDSDNSLFAELDLRPSSEIIPVLMRLVRTILSRKKVVFSTMYVVWLVGAAYYFLATRYYESTAKLLIVEQKHDQLSSVSDRDNSGKTMATHRELVKSPIVIQNAIRMLSPSERVDVQGVPPSEWAAKIGDRLYSRVTRETNLIEVIYQSQDPQAAAAVVRAIIRSYLQFVDQTHKGTAGEFIDVLKTGFSQRQQELTAKQDELQIFRKKIGHLAVAADDQTVQPMIRRMSSLNDAWTTAQVERLEYQAAEAAVTIGLERGEDINQHLASIEATLGKQMMLASMGLSSQDLQLVNDRQKQLFATQEEMERLSTSYGPNHPHLTKLKNQIASLGAFLETYRSEAGKRFNSMGDVVSKSVILSTLERTVREAEQKEKQLFEALEIARKEASQQSDHIVQLQIMEHDVQRLETYLDSLSEKIDTFDISQVQAPIKATVIREPLPGRSPVTPRLRFVVIVCFIGGTLLGVLIAYVQDILDDRFNNPEEISSQLGVPILAMVRNLDPLVGEGLAGVHTHALPNSAETEAFRTLRTALSLNGETSDRILISSSEPGDGKTTVSANLAVALAQAGNRTLVVDADLRRPGFTTMLNLKGKPGVADILASDQHPEQTAPPLVVHTEVEGLDILPVGLRRPNPAELLSGSAFVDLLAWADSKYDRVIVDCPPVLAVSDALVVGQVVDGAILVVRPEKNHRRSVIKAVESFRATGCRVIGAVANGLSNDASGYGYGYGYGYGDDYGHGIEDEMPSATTVQTAEASRIYSIPIPAAPGSIQSTLPIDPPATVRPRRSA